MRTVISVQTSLVCSTILRWGTEEQKQRYLPRLCSGEWLGASAYRARHGLGRRQPAHAGGAPGRRLVADQRGQDVDLDGRPRAAGARLRPDRPVAAHKGLACFLVETDQDGFVPPRSTGRWGCGRRTPRRSRSTTSSPARGGPRRGRRRLHGRDVGARLRALLRRRGMRGHLPGLASTSPCATPASATSSTGRSRASSSCRR
jgi:hypothetical protein